MKGFLRKSLNALRGDNRYHRLESVSELQWKSMEELRRLQFEDVRALLDHSVKTVPYYASMMKELGMTVEDVRSFDDFARLPVLTKDIIRQNESDLLSSGFSKEALVKNTSGGSTGEPLVFYQDKGLFEQMQINWMLGLSFAGWTPSDLVVCIWGNPKEFEKQPSRLSRVKEWLGGSLNLNAYQYNKSIMAGWLKEIRSHSSVYIYGYASVLTDLAEFALEQGVALPNVKGVMSSAEKLHDWQRECISRAFSCPVFDQYGSREVPCIACECEAGGMHLMTHSAYVEFAPEPGTDHQNVIVTCLTNHGMPFIRYEIGDFAAPLDTTCSCGRGFPLMKMDIGRSCDSFITPEGDSIYGTYFVRQLYGIQGITSFQYRQRQPDQILLQIVPGKGFSDDSRTQVAAVEQRIHDEISQAIALEVKVVDEIPKTSGGKHRHVICEIDR